MPSEPVRIANKVGETEVGKDIPTACPGGARPTTRTRLAGWFARFLLYVITITLPSDAECCPSFFPPLS